MIPLGPGLLRPIPLLKFEESISPSGLATLEYHQQDRTKDHHIDGEILSHSASSVEIVNQVHYPWAVFEGIVVAQELDEESNCTIENQSQSKSRARLGEKSAGRSLRPSPEQIEHSA